MSAMIWITAILAVFFLRLLSVLPSQRYAKVPRPASSKVKTMIILGSGGHTSEMLSLAPTLSKVRYDPRIYVYAQNDRLSAQKAKDQDKDAILLSIPRARNVGQLLYTAPFTTLYALFYAVKIQVQMRPELLITNGPGTAFPLIMAAYILRMASIGRPHPRIIYVESFARVKTPSLTAKLVAPFVDRKIAQWPLGKGWEYKGVLI